MAFSESMTTISLTAASDLSSKQFYFVAVDTDGKAALTGDDGNPIGVLQNKPEAGQAAEICIAGVTKLYIGTESGLGAGYNVGCDSNSAGKVSDTGSFRMGVALEDPTADGDIVSILLQKNGKQA
jgi:predicted RecA/RadA family phage recombinase